MWYRYLVLATASVALLVACGGNGDDVTEWSDTTENPYSDTYVPEVAGELPTTCPGILPGVGYPPQYDVDACEVSEQEVEVAEDPCVALMGGEDLWMQGLFECCGGGVCDTYDFAPFSNTDLQTCGLDSEPVHSPSIEAMIDYGEIELSPETSFTLYSGGGQIDCNKIK